VINWLIAVSIRNRFLIVAVFVLVAGRGYWALLLDQPERSTCTGRSAV